MSQIRKGIFGSLAIALTLGAVQLAFAHDLIGNRQATATAPEVGVTPEVGVNRAAKSDRASVPAAPGQTRTIALQHNGLTDTSVLVRLPVAKEESKAARNPSPVTKPASKRIAVACEPPVSILTDVAKLLQPGRCVT